MSILKRLQKLNKQNIITPPEWLFNNLHYLTITGSQAYGMSGNNSDLDLFGVYIEDRKSIFPHEFGLIHGFDNIIQNSSYQQHGIRDPSKPVIYDLNFYGFIKYFKLLCDGTPNVVETLFTPRQCVLMTSPLFERVRAARNLFLTKTFSFKCRMYGFAQIKRTERNIEPDSKRQKLIDEYGWDVKAGSHIRRLLSLSEDILLNEEIDLAKHAEAMKAIRTGHISRDEIKTWATAQETKLTKLESESTLPQKVNREKAKELLLECIELHYGPNDIAKISTVDINCKKLEQIRKILES